MIDLYIVNKKILLNIYHMNVRNRLRYGKKFMNGSRALALAAMVIILGEVNKKYKLSDIIIMATEMIIYSN